MNKKGFTNKGFTLVEILVVVLIIGILAAIAVPQYQKAVVKAKVAAIKPIITGIKQAEEVYYMANGQYTINLSLLDIDLPCEATDDKSLFICNDVFVYDVISGSSSLSTNRIDVYYCPNKTKPWQNCTTTYKDFIYRQYLDRSLHPGQIECYPYTEEGIKFCNILKD